MNTITIIVKLINRCNLNCTYCFDKKEQNKTKKELSKEQIFLAAKILLSECKEIHWIWHGGEPTLYGIKKIIEYTKEIKNFSKNYYSTIDFSIQTNGTLLTFEDILLLKEEDINIGISYDGIYQNNRTSKIIEDTILKNNGIICVSNVNKEDDLLKNYLFLKQKNIASLSFNIKFPQEDKNIKEIITQWKTFLNYYFKDETAVIEQTTIDYIKKIMNLNSCNCTWGDCNNLITLNSDGNFYFCDIIDNDNSLIKLEENFSLEDYFFSDYFKEILKKKSFFKEQYCNSCFLKNKCNGGCATRIKYFDVKQYSSFCEIRKEIYLYIESLLLNKKEIKNKIILNLIKV